MPLGNLDDRYVSQTATLRSNVTADGNAAAEAGQRSWDVPDLGSGDWSVAGLASAYDRTAVAAVYSEVLTQEAGTTGDAMAMKLQSDYLASQERAYRMAEQVGPVRAALHAAARRRAHGLPNGVFGRVDSYIQDLIMAGAAGFRL